MEHCLLQDNSGEKIVYAFTVIENFNEERKLRKAGELNQLICPCCRRPVHLRYGRILRPHFSHKSDDANHSCSYNEESMTHILGKEILYRYFRSKYPDVGIRFDYRLPSGRKANLYCSFPDGKELAVEFQRTNMSVVEWEERSESYRNSGLKALWILNFTDREYKALHSDQFLSFFKQMVLHDTDNRLLLLNVDKKILTVSKNITYHVMDKSYDLGFLSRDYPLDEILIRPDGSIDCDLEEEYEKRYRNLKESVDNMLREETKKAKREREQRKEEQEKTQAEKQSQPGPAGRTAEQPDNLSLESEAANHPDSSWESRKQQKSYQRSYMENRRNLSPEENRKRIKTTQNIYMNLLKRAANGDQDACNSLKRVYQQKEDIRKLIDTVLDDNLDFAARLSGLFH